MARFTPHPAPLLSPWVTTALGRSTTVTWSGGETATPKIWDEGVSMNGGTAEPLDKKRRKKKRATWDFQTAKTLSSNDQLTS